LSYLILIVGLAILIVSGEFLVKGAVNVAIRLKITPLVVGMTVVSFGTSAPELLVSIKAALNDHPQIAIGNVIGSNIANLALVLGITAIIFPMPVERNTIRFDWPMLMISTAMLLFAMQDLVIVQYEGVILFVALVAFITFIIFNSRKGGENHSVEKAEGSVYKDIGFILGGCVGLAVGASLLLDSAVVIAQGLGMSEHVIGVTIVAFGTSVPELVTSCVAAFRKQTDVSVGNLIGSNIFNIMAVLGITSIIKDIPINADVLLNDMPWVVGISLILLPFMVFGRKITRSAGFVLLFSYILYVVLLLN
jgi:cation:H+ antiporter